VSYNNDEHSIREKFIFVIWIGQEVKVMRRAKVCIVSPVIGHPRRRLDQSMLPGYIASPFTKL
jgi:hypothetical protein